MMAFVAEYVSRRGRLCLYCYEMHKLLSKVVMGRLCQNCKIHMYDDMDELKKNIIDEL